MTEIRQREVWVDWTKALLIYFVVIGHASLKDLPRDLVFTFHMPAFFVISGYLYHPTDWKKTTKRLILPVLFYSIINVCFMMLVDKLKTGTIDIERYATMSWTSYYTVAWPDKGYITPFMGVWFIVVLWFCRMLLGDIPQLTWIRRHCYPIALFMTAWMIAEPLVFPHNSSVIQDLYIYRTFSCFPFMVLGILLHERNDLKTQLFSCRWPYLAAMTALFLAMTLRNGYVSIWSNEYGNNSIVYFANGAIASILLITVCRYFKQSSIIETFSKGTLLILGLHPICIFVGYNILKHFNLFGTFIYPWLVGFFTLAVCYYPIRFFSKRHIPLI